MRVCVCIILFLNEQTGGRTGGRTDGHVAHFVAVVVVVCVCVCACVWLEAAAFLSHYTHRQVDTLQHHHAKAGERVEGRGF